MSSCSIINISVVVVVVIQRNISLFVNVQASIVHEISRIRHAQILNLSAIVFVSEFHFLRRKVNDFAGVQRPRHNGRETFRVDIEHFSRRTDAQRGQETNVSRLMDLFDLFDFDSTDKASIPGQEQEKKIGMKPKERVHEYKSGSSETKNQTHSQTEASVILTHL